MAMLERDTCTQDVMMERDSYTNMDSEITRSDTVLSVKEGKKKRKKKRGKKPDTIIYTDLVQQPLGDGNSLYTNKNCSSNDRSGRIDTKNNSEVDVVPTCQSTEHNVQAFNDSVSQETALGNLQAKNKKKRKSRGKNLESFSSGNGNPVSNDYVKQVVVDTCLTIDSELVQHDQELGHNTDIKNRIGDTSIESNDNANGSRDNHSKIIDTNIREENANPICRIAEHNDLACAGNVSGKMVQKKRRKRRKKDLNALTSNAVIASTCVMTDSDIMQHNAGQIPEEVRKEMHQRAFASSDKNCSSKDRSDRIDTKNSSIVNMVPSFQGTEHNVQACSESVSQETALGNLRAKKKRKRKSQGKNLESLSSGNDNHVSNDYIQWPVVDTCVTIVSEVVQHDSELGHDADIRKGIHDTSVESNDNNSGSRDTHGKIKETHQGNANPINEIAEHNDMVCADNVSRKMVKKERRKKRKKDQNALASNSGVASTCVTTDSEIMQHTAKVGIPEEMRKEMDQNAFANDKNCSRMDSSGIIDTKNNSEANVVPLSQGTEHNVRACNDSVAKEPALGDLQAKKKRKEKNWGESPCLESKEGATSCIDLSGKQKAKKANVNTGQNVLCVSGFADNTLKESTRTCTERIVSGERSCHNPINLFMERTPSGCFRRKLLILDLNGLLADIVQGNTGTYKADGNAGPKKVFKRPFCEDFLQFCFDRFTVGVWSSRRRENVDKVIKVIMGENRSKLAFIWDQVHCTETGEYTIGNREKPLLLKEIAKLWENNDGTLPWKEGDYTQANTLLLDDSPYKALRNPPNTAIFPNPYQYRDQKDNSLERSYEEFEKYPKNQPRVAGLNWVNLKGLNAVQIDERAKGGFCYRYRPEGDLRTYLDGLALAEDVQEYVKENPFGQKPITETSSSWKFYVKVRGKQFSETKKTASK